MMLRFRFERWQIFSTCLLFVFLKQLDAAAVVGGLARQGLARPGKAAHGAARLGKAGAVGAPSCMTAGAFCTSPLSRRNRSGQNGPAGPPCLAVVGTRAFYNRFKTGRSDFAASGLPIGSDFRDYRFCFSDMAQNCRFPGSPRKDRANGLSRPNLKRSCGRWGARHRPPKPGKMPMDSPLIFALGSFTVVAIALFIIFRSK